MVPSIRVIIAQPHPIYYDLFWATVERSRPGYWRIGSKIRPRINISITVNIKMHMMRQ
jgi:hypothetical protein